MAFPHTFVWVYLKNWPLAKPLSPIQRFLIDFLSVKSMKVNKCHIYSPALPKLSFHMAFPYIFCLWVYTKLRNISIRSCTSNICLSFVKSIGTVLDFCIIKPSTHKKPTILCSKLWNIMRLKREVLYRQCFSGCLVIHFVLDRTYCNCCSIAHLLPLRLNQI